MTVEDELQIRQVLAAYCRGVDRRDWALVRSCYHDDAREDHGLYVGDPDGFVEWLQGRNHPGGTSMHLLANVYVELAGDIAFVESYALSFHSADAGGEPGIAMGGCRYVDRFEQRGGCWRIADRRLVVEFMRPPFAVLVPPAEFTGATRDGDDVSFAMLASVLAG
jgi:hypothetical protein